MKVKFIQAAFKKEMIKVSSNGQEVWYDCDPKAKGFAKTAFQPGDDVELTTEDRGGKVYVTRVSRPGQANYNPNATQQAPAPQTQSQPSTAPTVNVRPAYGQKTPEESERISRLSAMSSASNAVQVLTGQINDPAVLGDIVVSLYNKMLAEIKK